MNSFKLKVSTPEGNAYEGEADALFLRGSEGDLAVLAGHAPLITSVKEGNCRILPAGEDYEIEADIKSGLLSVAENGETILLTTSFEIKE